MYLFHIVDTKHALMVAIVDACRSYRASCIRPRSCWSRFTVIVNFGNNCIWQCQQSSATSVPASNRRLCCHPDTPQPGNSRHWQWSGQRQLCKQWWFGEGKDGVWPGSYRSGLGMCRGLLCHWSRLLCWLATFWCYRFVLFVTLTMTIPSSSYVKHYLHKVVCSPS